MPIPYPQEEKAWERAHVKCTLLVAAKDTAKKHVRNIGTKPMKPKLEYIILKPKNHKSNTYE